MHNVSSPALDDAGMDRLMAATGATAPRVTKADIDANIAHVETVRHVTHSGQVLRWAIITLKNGFAVTGRPSAAVCPENDNVTIGEKVAYDNAYAEIWPLMGYALKDRLARQENFGVHD